MESFNNAVRSLLSVTENKYISSALTILLVVYASLAAPKLSERMARLFENSIFRTLIFFLIAYSSRKDPAVAAISAIGLMISLQTLNKYDIESKIRNMIPDINVPSIDMPSFISNNEPEVSEEPKASEEGPSGMDEGSDSGASINAIDNVQLPEYSSMAAEPEADVEGFSDGLTYESV